MEEGRGGRVKGSSEGRSAEERGEKVEGSNEGRSAKEEEEREVGRPVRAGGKSVGRK